MQSGKAFLSIPIYSMCKEITKLFESLANGEIHANTQIHCILARFPHAGVMCSSRKGLKAW